MDLLVDFHAPGLFVDLEFTSVAHYVQERLGLSASWCKAGLRLAWVLRRNPAVAKALRDGRLNQGQARLVCRVARHPWLEEWTRARPHHHGPLPRGGRGGRRAPP